MSTVLVWLVAGGLFACGTPSSQLHLTPSMKLIPLVNGPEPGTAIGRCVALEREGPTSHPCPMDLAPLIARNMRRGETGRGTYARGVYVDATALSQLTEDDETDGLPVTAYELATYHSTIAVWKRSVDEKTASKLERFCSDPMSSDVRVIVREFEGCGMTMSGTLGDSEAWSIGTLATQGTVLGQPRTFWSQDPTLALPPAKAKCAAARVVRVEALPVQSLCTTLLRPAREGVKKAVALD